MILAVSNFIFKTPARVTKASSDTFRNHQTYKTRQENTAFLNTLTSTKMTRTKLAQHAKHQDRSNIFKTKLKQTQPTFLAPRTHQQHQNHTGFITFFDNLVFVTIWPFPATRNPPRERFSRRRSNVIKIMVWTKIRPLETSQNVYGHMRFFIFARKIKQTRKHAISWFPVHADNQQAWHFMILAVSNFIFKTPARVTKASSETFRHHHNYQKR